MHPCIQKLLLPASCQPAKKSETETKITSKSYTGRDVVSAITVSVSVNTFQNTHFPGVPG